MSGSISFALIPLAIALNGSSAADAESVMQQCGDHRKAAKARGTTVGLTGPQCEKVRAFGRKFLWAIVGLVLARIALTFFLFGMAPWLIIA